MYVRVAECNLILLDGISTVYYTTLISTESFTQTYPTGETILCGS